MANRWDIDPVTGWVSRYEEDGNTVTRQLTRLDTRAVMEAKQGLEPATGLDWGRLVASVPLEVYEAMCRKYPEMRADSRTKQTFLAKWLSSPESAQYRY